MAPVTEVRPLHKCYRETVLARNQIAAGWAVAFGLAAARFFRWE